MSFEPLTNDYIQGYTHAIQDIIEQYGFNTPDIAQGKKMTVNLTKRFLEKFLEERSKFRDWHGTGKYFMRWNTQKEDFEAAEDSRW